MNPSEWEKMSPSRVRALFGLPPAALEQLLAKAVPAVLARRKREQANRPRRKRAVGAGRKRRLPTPQEVLLTLTYLRHNTCHEVVGAMFGVSADTSENTFHEVVEVLKELCPAERFAAQKRWQRGEPPWKPQDEDLLLIDSFETPVRRPSNQEAQRRVYSGKKKRHTVKTQVVTDPKGEILEIQPGYRGPTADKRLYEESGVETRFPEAEKRGDLGYQGAAGVKVPHKKPKGGELTVEQKEENRLLAQVRVHVEHGIRRIKGWRIMR